jgi:hypothetical protein
VATAVFAFVVLVSLVSALRWIVAIVIHRSQGFDPSDEAFYLISAATPGSAVARTSNFGFYLHLLREVTGGTVTGIRLGGLALLLLSTAVATWGLKGWLPGEMSPRNRRLYHFGAWVCITSVALTYYALWIVTPSYNLLALAVALVAFGGLLSGLPVAKLRGRPVPWWRPVGGFVFMGAASVVLADVKGTSAIGVGLLCIIILAGVLGWRNVVGAAWSIAVGMIAGLMIDLIVVGSPVSSVTKIGRLIHSSSFDGTHSSTAIFDTEFLIQTVCPWLVWFALATAAILVAWRWIRPWYFRSGIMAVSACVAAYILWDDHARGGLVTLRSDGWWWVRASSWTLLFLTAMAPRRTRLLIIGPLVALGGVAVAFGSNNGFVHQTALTAGLLALGVVAQATIVAFSVDGEAWRAIPALVFFITTSWASFGAVAAATSHPYRLEGPIEASTQPISIGEFGTVSVTPHLAEYIAGLRALAPLVPPDARDCLVDVSGGTPLSAIALGARNATMPWIAGGYSGSDRALAYMLTFAPCITGRVLLVDAPGGARRINLPAVLQGRASQILGSVHYFGYLDEVQVVSILEPAKRG